MSPASSTRRCPKHSIRCARTSAALVGWGFELIKHDYTSYDLFGRWGFAMGADLTNPGWHFADRFADHRRGHPVALSRHPRIRRDLSRHRLQHVRPPGRRTGGVAAHGRRHQRPRLPPHAPHGCQHAGLPRAAAPDLLRSRRGLRAGDAAAALGPRRTLDGPSSPAAARRCSCRPIPKRSTPKRNRAIRRAFATASVARKVAQPMDWMETTTPSRWRIGWCAGNVRLVRSRGRHTVPELAAQPVLRDFSSPNRPASRPPSSTA